MSQSPLKNNIMEEVEVGDKIEIVDYQEQGIGVCSERVHIMCSNLV